MNHGKYAFAQLFEILSKYQFKKCVDRYKGDRRIKSFTCWNQFMSMAFGQMTGRDSLRDTVMCLGAHQEKLYHLGIRGPVARSTLAEANESRDWRIYADFAQVLIQRARRLYADDKLPIDFEGPVYVIDSTVIDLCLSVFWWARFRKTKAAVKLHVELELHGNIPTFVHVTDARTHDVRFLDKIGFEQDAFYVMDRAYGDFKRLMMINSRHAYFVIRPRTNFRFEVTGSKRVAKKTGILADEQGGPLWFRTKKAYPETLRRITFFDKDQDRIFDFLTNNFQLPAIDIAMLYKHRWQIELFFKWIKQHLKIKKFWGESANAVKTQIWIAICVYLTVAITKKELGIDRTMYEILQILSISAFDKTQLNQLLSNFPVDELDEDSCKQLKLFNF